jgi:hypothetical protein
MPLRCSPDGYASDTEWSKAKRALPPSSSRENNFTERLVIAVRSAESLTMPVAPHQPEPKRPGSIAVTLERLKFEAAERLGINQGGIQNWEREVRPISKAVELACQEITRLWQQRPDFGRVILVVTDGPILRKPDGPYSVPLLRDRHPPQRICHRRSHAVGTRSHARKHSSFPKMARSFGRVMSS